MYGLARRSAEDKLKLSKDGLALGEAAMLGVTPGRQQEIIQMAWLALVLAGLFEIGWAIGLKYTQGFTRIWPSVLTLAAMGASVFLLALALKTIPIGAGYAVWTGIGAAGTAILGMYLFGESTAILRVASIGLIVLGIIGLKWAA